jgi:hypothetical protein
MDLISMKKISFEKYEHDLMIPRTRIIKSF